MYIIINLFAGPFFEACYGPALVSSITFTCSVTVIRKKSEQAKLENFNQPTWHKHLEKKI